jgi:transposase-like protein
MIVCSVDDSGRPSACCCGGQHFHRHGRYRRIVAQEWVLRFICVACRATLSLLPGSCVPFKHHPSKVIRPVLTGMLLEGRSGRYFEREQALGIHGSTAYRWAGEFRRHASVLGTEGALRLGLEPVRGHARAVYARLTGAFGGPWSACLGALQAALSRRFPGLGIFRPLTL